MVCVYTVFCKDNFLVQFGYGNKRDMGSFFLMSIGSEEEVNTRWTILFMYSRKEESGFLTISGNHVDEV